MWNTIPLLRIVLFFIVGVVIASTTPAVEYSAIWGLLIFFTLIYLIVWKFRRKMDIRIVCGILGLLMVMMTGYARYIFFKSSGQDYNVNQNVPVLKYEVVITDPPEEREKTWRCVARLTAKYTEAGWKKSRGNILLYFQKSDFKKPFQYGDQLIVKSSPAEIPPPQNPYEFNYKEYLGHKNIIQQDFLRKPEVLLVGHTPPSRIMDWAIELRSMASDVLKKFIPDKQAAAVTQALLLGQKDELDDTLLQSYATAGVMHVLAVSGLHVGILYWMILMIFRPLGSSVPAQISLTVISISILWMYAMITGLSPSVLRAVTMFSFFSVGRLFARKGNTFNILAASALCLLLYDPDLIFSVGFQLSYLAVAGIIYFYPRFYTLWIAPNAVMDFLWKMVCASCSAQLATFPLTIYYFHQFPVYFLLANLFVIPAASLVMIGGISLLIVQKVFILAKIAGNLLSVVIGALNKIVGIIGALPGTLISGINFEVGGLFLLIGAMMACIFMIEFKKLKYGWMMMGCMLIFVVRNYNSYNISTSSPTMVVYHLPGTGMMDIFDGNECYFLSDSFPDPGDIAFSVSPNRLHHHTDKTTDIKSQKFYRKVHGNKLIIFDHKTILWVTALPDLRTNDDLTVDYLVAGNNSIDHISDLQKRIKFGVLILDASNSYLHAGKLREEAGQLGIKVHSVLQDGAFMATL